MIGNTLRIETEAKVAWSYDTLTTSSERGTLSTALGTPPHHPPPAHSSREKKVTAKIGYLFQRGSIYTRPTRHYIIIYH